jgi:hypothetical protein
MIVNLSKVSCKYRNNNKNMWPDSRKHSKFGYLFQKLISIGVLLQIIGICGKWWHDYYIKHNEYYLSEGKHIF